MYSSWGNNLDSTTASIIWYNYFKDRNITIVKVVYNINGTYVKEMEGNMLIITNYTNFSEVLNDYPHILEKYQNTLFIFHKVTWEMVRILFRATKFISINGGSHTKRHLISPLEVRLIDYLERIKAFQIDSLVWFQEEKEKMGVWSEDYKNLLTNNQNRDWTLTDKIASDELIYKMSLRKYYEVNLRENIERVISEYKNLLYSTSINSFKNYDSKITINFKILYNSYYS